MTAGDPMRESASEVQRTINYKVDDSRRMRERAKRLRIDADDTRRQADLLDSQASALDTEIKIMQKQIAALHEQANKADAAEKALA